MENDKWKWKTDKNGPYSLGLSNRKVKWPKEKLQTKERRVTCITVILMIDKYCVVCIIPILKTKKLNLISQRELNITSERIWTQNNSIELFRQIETTRFYSCLGISLISLMELMKSLFFFFLPTSEGTQHQCQTSQEPKCKVKTEHFTTHQ